MQWLLLLVLQAPLVRSFGVEFAAVARSLLPFIALCPSHLTFWLSFLRGSKRMRIAYFSAC